MIGKEKGICFIILSNKGIEIGIEDAAWWLVRI